MMPFQTSPPVATRGAGAGSSFAAALVGAGAAIACLHVLGWGALLVMAFPAESGPQTATLRVGIGVTAYMLGVRHAFDADHIAAIDNTTRELMQQGVQPARVGFWFSCGHSTIVLALTLLLALGATSLHGAIAEENSRFHLVTGLLGTAASSLFLFAIAALNLVTLAHIWRTGRNLRTGGANEGMLDHHLDERGLMNRLVGRVAGSVTKPWQMYLVGLLFGLGFDTATEVGLLVLATSSAVSGLPWYAVLCLPVLFAAGMSLFDTLQGSFMTAAYGWAFVRPVRKIYYNLVVTGLSVAVALIVGSIEVIGLVAERLELRGPVWDFVSALDLNVTGFVIAGLFVVVWLAALAVWRLGSIEERWSPGLGQATTLGE
ncbi:High-affinity nickel transport protein [Starkeya nomas]|uniref:Nickel/cobalt efflux system n=1 Tax=Starkeya nomas TaxID=2666134 RepID=A0A5S9NI20_9HYPH|nr:HoxN/HupN/NixA family nickel/cobalt transporter [Starkeya nomas]CAA0090212.1 High-affinity nickel transport protein [Starkeya nomas]